MIAALVLLGGLVGVGLWAAGVFRQKTEQGDLVLETDDPDFAFSAARGGGITLEDRKTKRTYHIKVVPQGNDQHALEVTDADAELTFKMKTLTIKRGEKLVVRVWFEPRQAATAKTPAPLDEVRLKKVAALPAAQQVKAVAAKLKELNRGFDGKVSHEINNGVVTDLGISTARVKDLSPVRALTGLHRLACSGKRNSKGLLDDLSPLRGMKLTSLAFRDTRVSDLSPLKGMPLTSLGCANTNVSDLSSLKGMKLIYLHCHRTQVWDLSPLEGMPLTDLVCSFTKVSDLTPLKGMPLTILSFNNTKVTDLRPLRGMKLTELSCAWTKVSDLSPLAGMPLTQLLCDGTKVTDLAPLKGMPLKVLACDFKAERDADILRSIKTLRKINAKPAKQFWDEVDRKKP
jgi:hypothetical protein